MRFAPLLVLALATGCSATETLPDGSAGAPDGAVSRDAGTGSDASRATDGGLARDGGSIPDAGPRADAGMPPSTIGPADRPAKLVVPDAYDGETPLPAVVLLHGYGVTGALQDAYFRFSETARTAGFYAVIPNGTVDSTGKPFWNATDYCCDLGHTGVDDVGYLTAVVDNLEAVVPVSQLYFMGHSNGGFMSYRMACELSDRISAIASLAGSDFWDETRCVPDQPVSVLEMHGDTDTVVLYDGVAGLYPGAQAVVERWAGHAGCDTSSPVMGDPVDLVMSLPGAETDVSRYTSGCSGADAALWTIHGGVHIPVLQRDFASQVLTWLSAHAR